MTRLITVRCDKFLSTVPHFTDGKLYEARHHVNALFSVRDDRGHERYIIPDEPCPHLPPTLRDPQLSYGHWKSESLGRFVTITATPAS